ncbi:MAG: hypothetical protein NTZ25_03690 [Candidatus Peregrinibacteria bacterium]|nr:hypothetical protein [Candidatus Peregrinibacteria bacterium]
MLKYRDKLTKLEYQMGKPPAFEKGGRAKVVEKTRKVEKPVVKAEHLEAKKVLKAKSIDSRRNLAIMNVDARYDSKKFTDSYVAKYPNGEFPDEEKALRTMKMGEGIIMRHDVGINYYLVQEADSFAVITEKLSRFPFFSYLKDLSKSKIKGFNISGNDLHPGKWIIIPPHHSPAEGLTDEKFIDDCRDAIKEIQKDPIYGRFIVELLKKTTEDQIVAMMLACAKTESGNGRFDQFSLFRYQGNQKAYSLSLFHILMHGAGLKARQNLWMTEGQTLTPKNSVKLFLAFMIEKDPDNFQDLFPLEGKTEDFASFYNGNWQLAVKKENARINERNKKKKKGEKLESPAEDYPTRLGKNYEAAKAMLRI